MRRSHEMCLACWPCRSGGQLREAPGHQWCLIPTLWEKKSGNKIRTKVYIIKVVIAKVKSPILGWDFIRKCKFDWIWGEFGDLYLRDLVAGISKRLEHVAIANNYLPRLSEDLPTVGFSTSRTNKTSVASLEA